MKFRGTCCLVFIAIARIATTEQAVKNKYKCQTEGWMLNGGKCYKWGVSPRNFFDASDYCVNQNASLQRIETKEENEYFKEDGAIAQYWLGFQLENDYKNGMCWKFYASSSCLGQMYTNWISPGSMMSSSPMMTSGPVRTSIGSCAVWNSGNGHWEAITPWSCSSDVHIFLCEQKAVCQDSYFGPKCSKQCHCYGETCHLQNTKCKYGCQRGWSGDLCSKRKQKPTALYYCFNTKTGGKRLVFRADLKGTNFRQIHAVDANNNPIITCVKPLFKQSGDHLTISIASSKHGFQPSCGEEKIADNTFKWKFEFKEFPSTRSAYDVTFEATCTFLTSDSLQRSAEIVNKHQESQMESLTKSNFTVDLRVVDPFTGIDVKAAPLGTQAKLVLSLHGKKQEIGVQAIFPHSCTAATDDEKQRVHLLDEHGCQTDGSQVIFANGNGTNWWSKPFELFTFPGYDHVTITCLFDVCFMENISECSFENMCNGKTFPSSRTKRSRRAGTRVPIGFQ